VSGAVAEPAAPRWSSRWEADVSGRQHEELAGLLRRCFPTSRAGFDGAASWASARPELRIVGRVDNRAVAHLAVLRRFLQVGGRALLVGDVGLVAVDPDRQGSGLGAELLDRAATALRALDVPFGFLTCGEHVAGFYATAGWVRVANPVRMIRRDGRVQVYGGCAMALPARAGMDAWPSSGRLDRNGYEV
jgi:nodulation protein A